MVRVLLDEDLDIRLRKSFAIVVLRPRTKRLRHLQELIPPVENLLPDVGPGQVVEVHPPDAP